MTTPQPFPTLAGIGWSVHKKPVFSTIVASHVSGREVRDQLYVNPIWQFELTVDGLSSSTSQYPNLGSQSLQSLMGFFLSLGGQFGTFLFTDPSDDTVSNGALINTATGTSGGDGTTTVFTLARFMGAFQEPIGWINVLSSVLVNGSASSYTLTAPNTITFATAPPGPNSTPTPLPPATVTASFTFYFQCRFDADDLDFDQFMSNLWKVESLKFRSVRSS